MPERKGQRGYSQNDPRMFPATTKQSSLLLLNQYSLETGKLGSDAKLKQNSHTLRYGVNNIKAIVQKQTCSKII